MILRIQEAQGTWGISRSGLLKLLLLHRLPVTYNMEQVRREGLCLTRGEEAECCGGP